MIFDLLYRFMPSKNAIIFDPMDRLIVDNITAQSKELQAIREKGTELLKTFPALQEDIFYSLYKPWPEMRDKDRILPGYALNYAEMEKLLETPAYHDLRQYTRLDDLGAALGSKALLEELCERLSEDKALQEAVQQVNEAASQQQKVKKLEQRLKSGSKNQKANEETQEQLEQANTAAQEASAKVEEMLASSQSQLRRAVTAAATQAASECEEVESILMTWGFGQGQFQQLPFNRKLELLEVLRRQQKFRNMTKLVGRMRNLAAASRKTKLDNVQVELHSITTGDDLSHALTQELVALRHPALKLDLYRKLYEKLLLQYELKLNNPVGHGPIVCLIDSSGSMAGTRDEWAKAVAMGLLEIALKERRPFAYAVFGSAKDPLITDTFQAGERNPDKIINMVTAFYGGGTNFEQPLCWALNIISQAAFKQADIVMVTDGACRVSDDFFRDFLAAKKAKEFSVWSILIGHSATELQRWSDEVWCVEDLMNDSAPAQVFQRI